MFEKAWELYSKYYYENILFGRTRPQCMSYNDFVFKRFLNLLLNIVAKFYIFVQGETQSSRKGTWKSFFLVV